MVLSHPSGSAGDPLSEVLAALGARSARHTRLEAAGDWALSFPARARLKFVAQLRGACWIRVEGQPPLALAEGDTFLLGDIAYSVASHPELTPAEGAPLYANGQSVARLGGAESVAIGGGIAFAAGAAGFLLEALPRFLHLPRQDPAAASVTHILRLLEAEAAQEEARPGGALVRDRLAEILLVEAIRAHIAGLGEALPGWVGALRDRRIAAALRLLHGDLAHPWTVGELAARTGMSRSAFAALFTRKVGRPPLDYLAQWRMLLARRLLDQGGLPVSEIAARVGYASPSAFGHAFSRRLGHTPRRGALPAEAAR
ncbi:AraC family transcriptional regulator [Pseudoroseomonas cervicalis]|uniref:AraC family transcriptional regulator n=1 Tax=Teichococcus cervicalis TaxID=204525 RepID=UPI002784B5AB|nr:AraC family transcriptional regulator [Pseudoroseomonas cervicalis]MDQ1079616.1 AraC-like DNA-binding protein [Pseudoroseomonas cervicalis]